MRTPLHTLFENARKDRGWTNEELHEALERYPWPPDVQPPALATVGHWCNGTRRPRNMEHLIAMCVTLGLSLDDVIVQNEDEAKTAVEQRIIRGVRELSPEWQEYVLATVEMAKKQRPAE
jgi:hypothetical protein